MPILTVETYTGGVVRTVDLGMAIKTAPVDEPRVGQDRSARKISTRQQVVWMTELVMTLLAKEGPDNVQEFFMIGTVRKMAVNAVLSDRGVFP